jgi:AcrR family transcriptional regulator
VFGSGRSAILVGSGGAVSHMEKRVASAAKLSFLAGKGSDGGSDRRVLIANAMDNCIRDKGYAATTLTDIAVKAGMSPSHIRYYFDGKEEILEFYLEATCAEITREIAAIARRAPAQWLDDFTAYFFGNPAMTREAVAVLVEVFAAAAHNPKLARIKAKYDDFIRKTFLEFFRWAGCADGMTPADAAYMAAALDSGMKFNAVFQKDFSREKAAKTFLAEMYRMAGIQAAKR